MDILKLIGTVREGDESVTRIGELLVKIPIEPFLSRAIVESMFFERVLRSGDFVNKYVKIPPR